MNRVSNQKQFNLLLVLAGVLLPSIGIIVAIMAPSETPHGPGMTSMTRVIVACAFAVAGMTTAGYFMRTIPVRLELTDTLTIHYFLHKQALRPSEVVAISVEDRSVTLKSQGSLPITAKDTMLTIDFTDATQLSLSLPKEAAIKFQSAIQTWQAAASQQCVNGN